MEMVKIRFSDEANEDFIVDVAKRMSVVGLRDGTYVIPSDGLKILDKLGSEYDVVERGGYDALVVGPLRGLVAGSV